MNTLYTKLIGIAAVCGIVLVLGIGLYVQHKEIQGLNQTVGRLNDDLKAAKTANDYNNALLDLNTKLNEGFAKLAATNAAAVQEIQQGVSKQNDKLKKALSNTPCANELVPDIAICVLQPSKCSGSPAKGTDDSSSRLATGTKSNLGK